MNKKYDGPPLETVEDHIGLVKEGLKRSEIQKQMLEDAMEHLDNMSDEEFKAKLKEFEWVKDV